METRSPYRDRQVDFALNHFLDAIAPIETIQKVVPANLKVSAFFDPEKVSALNFEIASSTMNRVAKLGCTFDIWAMPVG